MVYVLFAIIISLIIFYFCKTKNLFNGATAEELTNFQETVFIHMDKTIEDYKKTLENMHNEKSKVILEELDLKIEEANKIMYECMALEKRLDEKIEKIKNFNELIRK